MLYVSERCMIIMKPVVIIVTIKIPMILTLIFLLLIQLAIPPVTGAM